MADVTTHWRNSSLAGSAGGLLRRLGRAALWAVLAILLLRGISSLMPAESAPPPPHHAAVWPTAAAEAYAEQFARVYLANASTEAYTTDAIGGDVAPSAGSKLPHPKVAAPAVVETHALDPEHALITVAAAVDDQLRYLAVPVYRDDVGRLAVYDLPSFVGPPGKADVDTPQGSPVVDAAITNTVTGFLRGYLSGDDQVVGAFSARGARVHPLAQGLRFSSLDDLSALAAPGEYAATVRAFDPTIRVTYSLRYLLRLVRDGRWYVAQVNDSHQEG